MALERREAAGKLAESASETTPGERFYWRGLDALVRIPIVQRSLDEAAGLNTSGYITGYRGSPLGGYDAALSAAAEELAAHDVHFHPAVNEELAATAVWGTQQVGLWPDTEHRDGGTQAVTAP